MRRFARTAGGWILAAALSGGLPGSWAGEGSLPAGSPSLGGGSPTEATSARPPAPPPEEARVEALRQRMRDFRIAYRSLKDSIGAGVTAEALPVAERAVEVARGLAPLAPPEDPRPFGAGAERIERSLEALAAALRAPDPGAPRAGFEEVRASCRACHAHYRGGVARFMENLFLF